MEKSSELVVMVTYPCEYGKNYWTVHFKRVNFIIRELYHNKAVKKMTNPSLYPLSPIYQEILFILLYLPSMS